MSKYKKVKRNIYEFAIDHDPEQEENILVITLIYDLLEKAASNKQIYGSHFEWAQSEDVTGQYPYNTEEYLIIPPKGQVNEIDIKSILELYERGCEDEIIADRLNIITPLVAAITGAREND